VTTVTAVVSLRYFWIRCELDLGIFCDKCPELTFAEEAKQELRCNGFLTQKVKINQPYQAPPRWWDPMRLSRLE